MGLSGSSNKHHRNPKPPYLDPANKQLAYLELLHKCRYHHRHHHHRRHRRLWLGEHA